MTLYGDDFHDVTKALEVPHCAICETNRDSLAVVFKERNEEQVTLSYRPISCSEDQ